MSTLYQILGLLGACFIIWILYKNIKNNPETFSKENFSKSFMTMGLLAMGIIGFVYVLILMVKS